MIMDINTQDGLMFKGKLSLPEGDGAISKLVIIIGGAGPTTYNNGFPAEFCTNKEIAHFSYNTRGVDVTEKPPFYTMNYDDYKTYLPSNSVEDICCIIKTLKRIKRLATCKVLLNGWSEGATIAPLFASKYPDMVDGLFLCGYSNINMKDLQIWQCSRLDGGNKMFDECFSAIERKDNEWLMGHMGLTSEWFIESYNLLSNNDLLPTLDLPIYIFNGALDGYCDIEGVYEIRDVFAKLNKSNLIINIFNNHGHGLDVINSLDDKMSDGIKSLLDALYNF